MVPPLTLCAYMKKGPNLRWSLIQCSGGDEGDRTPDLLTASQALSQLSYAPVTECYYRGKSQVLQEGILSLLLCLGVFLTHGINNRLLLPDGRLLLLSFLRRC